MPTLVHTSDNEFSLLSIPNVRVLIQTENRPTDLGNQGPEYGYRFFMPFPQTKKIQRSIVNRLKQRDWRSLREKLVNLNLEDDHAVCEWLGLAGYVPQAMLQASTLLTADHSVHFSPIHFTERDMLRMSAQSLGWTPGYVTREIRQWIERYRDVFAWLMSVDEKLFREAIKRAKKFALNESETNRTKARVILSEGKSPKLKDPGQAFLRETNAPANLHPQTLGLALRGTATSEVVRARFLWDYDGRPGVIAYADSPIDAICLSIHIDRNFSSRRWVQCTHCGKWLEQVRGRDHFCSAKCRDFFNTSERRKRIGFVVQGVGEWAALPKAKRAGCDRWKWIAQWATKKSVEQSGKQIDASWAKEEFAKIEARKNLKRDRHPGNSQGEKNGTKEAR